MSIPHLQISHICRRQMSIPHLQISHICRRQMSIPHLHLWRGGGRQAGGEVRQAGGEVKHQSMRSDVITPLKKYVYF